MAINSNEIEKEIKKERERNYYFPFLLKDEMEDVVDSLTTKEQYFSLDDTTPGFPFWPRFILMMNIYTIVSKTSYQRNLSLEDLFFHHFLLYIIKLD